MRQRLDRAIRSALVGLSILAVCSCGGTGSGWGGSPAIWSIEDTWPSLARVAGTACLKPILATAVVVGDDLLLTVAHAVAGSEDDLTVIDVAGNERAALVVAFDPELDLALLEADGFDQAIDFAAPEEDGSGTLAVVGSDLVVAANPYRIVRIVTASIGDIYDQGQLLRQVIEIEARVSPGDSGAPLLDEAGAMVGMVFATSDGVEASAWATHLSEIEAFLGQARSGLEVDRGRCR